MRKNGKSNFAAPRPSCPPVIASVNCTFMIYLFLYLNDLKFHSIAIIEVSQVMISLPCVIPSLIRINTVQVFTIQGLQLS